MDEMDLMKKLSDVPSPSPEAYDRARTALQAAMTEPEAAVVRPKRWFSWTRAGIAAVGAAAVAAAVVMGTTGGSAPTAPTQDAAPQVVESPLVKLASDIRAAAQPGDSSLVITTKPAPDGGKPHPVYTLYTDKGQIFIGDSVQTLKDCAVKNDDQATEYHAKTMAAARLAATGDVEKAKFAMTTVNGNPWGLGLSPAEAEKVWAESWARTAEQLRKLGKEVPASKPRPTGAALDNLVNNHLWSNTTSTLFNGAANADVRAGVLKLLATMKDVSIAKTVVGGQAALTLTADPAILGGDGSQVLTINADNGLPISSEVFPAKDSKTPSKHTVVTYQSSRVNLADVLAGKI
jgi:hypothetical protein